MNAYKNYIVVVARGACFKKDIKMQDVMSDIKRALYDLKLLNKKGSE